MICERQGEVSHTMGHFPFSLALSREASSSAPFLAAASLKPRELNIMPQQLQAGSRGGEGRSNRWQEQR